jgi:5-methylcytosine-specific restriction protein A
MPYKAKRSCMAPGCSNTYDGQGAYCPEHKGIQDKQYNATTRDKAKTGFYHSVRWRAIRTMILSHEPLCRVCRENGDINEAQEVHHIDGDYANNIETNLMPICISCHNKQRT